MPGRSSSLIEITCPHWRRARVDGLVVHESRAFSDRDITIVDAIPVTTVERTIFDLCAVRGRKTVDLAIDNALRRELTTFDKLAATSRRLGRRGLKGTRLLRALLAERDPQYTPTASEQEQLLLDVLRRCNFPEPVRQFEVRDEFAAFVARVDLAYPELMIVIEYDSYQEHIGNQPLVRDARRRNAIGALGYAIVVATAEDVRYGQGHALASALRRTIALAQRRRAA
jgi:very-short-patch-repair endonuclease